MRDLLLISTSTTFGTGYLDHCAETMKETLGTATKLLFIPFALHDQDAYAEKARERFAAMGVEVESLHRAEDPRLSVRRARAIFVGGGNTFRLVARLHQLELLDPIRDRVREGMAYMGTSAGSNVACPTLMTTNDMPILQPPSFETLNLVPFQINPHYLDPDPSSRHMGETRETRILEYLEENDRVVVGLREGAMIRVQDNRATLLGSAGARIFRRQADPEERPPGADLSDLL